MSDLTKFVERMTRVTANENEDMTRRVRDDLIAMKQICDRLLERLADDPCPNAWTLPGIAADLTAKYAQLHEIRKARETWERAIVLTD
jgi:hypothetical protein